MPTFAPKDQNVPVKLVTPLGEHVLLARTVRGEERMSGLFKFDLHLISEDPGLEFSKTVGQKITVKLMIDEQKERFFNGFITEFRFSGKDGQYYRYEATMRPWLWLLTRTSDCRIFQNMNVSDIIKEVFKLNNMVDFELSLSEKYRVWDYCVQYNESDFDFICRLMEQEGMYYFFRHEANKHVMVITDNANAHSAYPGYPKIQYIPDLEQGTVGMNTVNTWTAKQSMVPNKYAIQDYDFENPKTNLLSKYTKSTGHDWPIADPEIYDYPGEYVKGDEGRTYAEIRLEELLCQRERVQASGQCRGFSPGCTFELYDYPRSDQNKEYLTVSIRHEMNNHEFMSGEQEDTAVYECSIEVLAKDRLPFRAPRNTPRPKVLGPQTAVVVGPKNDKANSEIYTDKYGRVKVQFHWDRYGESDDKSSCWIRVSQLWAGTKWGGIHIPRIGQEVVVSFLEGDPDRPLITGSVYNANYMPPYTLADNKTQSGIKSRSTTGGGADNFNEIRMEDKIGSEELYIQAEKDENILVKNNKTENVGNNETITIGNDRTETVKHDETITVQNNRVETVQMNETLTVLNDRTRNVAKNETVTIGQSRMHTVAINEDINIGVAQEVIIGGLQAIEIGAAQTVGIGASQSIEVGGSRSLDVGSDYNMNVGKDRNSEIGAKESVKIGKEWVVEVQDSITIKCGSAQFIMKKDGTIQLKGKDISLKASGKIDAKAGATMTLKGSSIKEN